MTHVEPESPDIDPGATPPETPAPSPDLEPEILPPDTPEPDIDPGALPEEAPQRNVAAPARRFA